jgi:prevent-host-death family protein
MFVKSTEVQNNFGKYLSIVGDEDVTILRNGKPIARLIGIERNASFLIDSLVGVIPEDVDERALKNERLMNK